VEKSMPFDLPLPPVLSNVGWRVKIRDKEIREPPHVTIVRKTCSWRINLRTKEFMDKRPHPRMVPEDLLQIIQQNWVQLCQQWDAMYPNNPVADDEV
jgi:hypothetical protein